MSALASEPSHSGFPATHWSVVLAAGESASPESRAAVERLCRSYWYPLYAFVRRQGQTGEDARDLTQAFFERFLEHHYLKDAVRGKGRFRTFLLIAFKRFLADRRDHSAAAKRGGGISFVPWDTLDPEAQFHELLASTESPEAVFDRAWAEATVQGSVGRLQAEYEAAGKGSRFHQLKGYLSRPADRASYTAAAQQLGLSADAVAMAVVRLRRRYRALVRVAVADTVATPAEIDDEMRYLVQLLTG